MFCLCAQGFRKVIKKHDKLTSSSLKETYWPLVEERYPDHKKEVLQQVGRPGERGDNLVKERYPDHQEVPLQVGHAGEKGKVFWLRNAAQITRRRCCCR